MNEEYLKNIKKLYRDKTNNIVGFLVLITCMQLITLGFCVYAYIHINKKIDFRYFNTTHSLENIHNVKIDTYDGSVRSYR